MKARRSVAFRELTRFTSMIVECKSIAGYHLLFSAVLKAELRNNPHWWVGNDKRFVPKMIELLRKHGLSEPQALRFDRLFRRLRYTKDGLYRIAPVTLDALPAPMTFTAFRETNVGTTRDLESSVLWQASQQLRAVAHAELAWARAATLDAIEACIYEVPRVTTAHRKQIEEELAMQVRWLHCVHPIIVVEASLWEVLPTGVRPIRWCWVAVGAEHEDVMPWIDVVDRLHASGYFQAAQAHHEKRGNKRT